MAKFNVGGQAVIEGVMMRSPNYYAVACRNEKGKIVSKTEKIKKRSEILQKPFIRGIVNLGDMLVLGVKSLIWSANQQSDEEEEQLNSSEIFWTLFIAFSFAIVFFIALPYFLTNLAGFVEETRPILFNFIDAVIKIAIFVVYLKLISLMEDVKRLFEYHGAEHKVVYCYEAGKKLTVKNAKKYSTKHPRCGTSFIFIVFVFSILIFSLLPVVVIALFPNFNELSFGIRKAILFPLRILFIPVVAGASYELLKLSGKLKDNLFVKIITFPGIAFQKITTSEPDNKQIEVAIASLMAVLKKEK